MPRNYKRKLGARNYQNYTQEILEEALSKVRNKELSLRDAQKVFGIHRNTLWKKLKADHGTENPKKPGGQPALTDEEENQIEASVIAMAAYGFPLTLCDIRYVVKAYLDRLGKKVNCFKRNLPGPDWARSFLKRKKNLSQRYAQNISFSRAASDEVMIESFFENCKKEVEGVPPTNVWNYDETNLVDDPGSKKIITKRGTKYPEQICNSSKANTSLMFCGNASGTLAPVYVNYKAECLYTEWTEGGPPSTSYNRTKSGWFDNRIFEDWFFKTMMPILKNQDGKKLLIGDNLSSHFSYRVVKTCEENNIMFICLPPNATHLMQPLDVAFFRPLKMKWRQVLEEWKNPLQGGHRQGTVPKTEFPSLLKKLIDRLITGSQNLISGFKKTGLYPVNKEEVLSRLPAQLLQNQLKEATHVLSTAFLERLEKKRTEVTEVRRKKRTKINVLPGTSVRSEDLLVPVPVLEPTSPSEVAGPSSLTHKQKKALNKGSKMKRRLLSSDEESDVDDLPEIQFDETDSSICEFSGESDDVDDCSTDNTRETVQIQKKLVNTHNCKFKKGDYMIVCYEGQYYPGRVNSVDDEGANISTLERSGRNTWRWPVLEDKLDYRKENLIRKIKKPRHVGSKKRKFYEIPEMKDYAEFM